MLVAEGSKLRPLIRSVAPARRVRVLVVEENEVLRSGLRWLLTRVPWVERCAGAGSLEEALAGGPFDLALVDVGLGLAVCERSAPPGAPTALLTSRWDEVPMRVARAAGARGAIAKSLPARELLGAVRELARGGICEPQPPAPGDVRFAPREREILRLVSDGLTNAEIGATLFLAPGTIKHHMLGLYEKLGAPNRAAAVHSARRLGVLADPREPFTAPGEPARVLVADPVDVRRAGVLIALQGRDWVAASAGARTLEDALAVAEKLGRSSCWPVTTRWRARSRVLCACATTARSSSPPRPRGAASPRASATSSTPLPPERRTRRSRRSSGSPRTPSSSTPRRSSASSVCAIAPKPCGGPTSWAAAA